MLSKMLMKILSFEVVVAVARQTARGASRQRHDITAMAVRGIRGRITPMPQLHHGHDAEFDNIIWHALAGPHRHLAQSIGATRWYPGDMAPFIAVATVDTCPDLDAALAGGFRCPGHFAGIVPKALPAGWRVIARSTILQMFPTADPLPTAADPLSTADDEGIRVLGIADRPAMLALAQTAFPDYFRERTAELGDYLGICDGADLVAMAGERLAHGHYQEISGVCTHPRYTGRGFARRLTQALMRRHRARGMASFLHVSENNLAARRLYESMGFAARASLPLATVEPAAAA
jgi:GNAT superfamily N-acetyltransferase